MVGNYLWNVAEKNSLGLWLVAEGLTFGTLSACLSPHRSESWWDNPLGLLESSVALAWLRSGSSRELAAHLAVKQPLCGTHPVYWKEE